MSLRDAEERESRLQRLLLEEKELCRAVQMETDVLKKRHARESEDLQTQLDAIKLDAAMSAGRGRTGGAGSISRPGALLGGDPSSPSSPAGSTGRSPGGSVSGAQGEQVGGLSYLSSGGVGGVGGGGGGGGSGNIALMDQLQTRLKLKEGEAVSLGNQV